MTCPACKSESELRLETVDGGLRVRECPTCEGRWVRSDDYWRWWSKVGEAAPSPHPTPEATVPEEPELRFCPEDGYILARFHVGSSHPFMIDQCRNCSGVWLDGGEWEALQAGGLSNRMHLILSEEWQDDLRKAQRESIEEEGWLRRLGEADLARIRDIREWMNSHPKRSELYAFLKVHERVV